ncbi:hypothetical protein ASF30_10780 [Leifsonia sp. Leaf264]|nr:hypothetical protein ASF30_10780 [Leifsonia sp. Leaf264]
MFNLSSTIRAWKLTRSGSLNANPQVFVQTAGVFASGVVPGTAIVAHRDERGLAHYMLTPEHQNAASLASHLSRAVAARVDPVDHLPDLGSVAKVVSLRTGRRPQLIARDTQFGADPAAVSRALSVSMAEGEWVAAVLRRPTNSERRWMFDWLAGQFGQANPTYHARRGEALLVSLYAGSDSVESASQLLAGVTAAMPGFDLDARPVALSRSRDALPMLGFSVAAGVAAWFLSHGVADTAHLPEFTGTAAWAAAGASLLGALGLSTGHIRGRYAKMRAGLSVGRFPKIRKKALRPARAQEPTFRDGVQVTGKSNAGYGLVNDAFMLGQELPVSLAAPHGGTASGESSTAVREAPAVMNQIIGPRIGRSAGKWVALSAKDLWQGIMFLGVPGSGKSVALRNLWAWMCMERARPSGRDGYPGARNVVIALETKGEGAAAYKQMSQEVGDSVGVCDLADDTTPAIDMFPRIGSLENQARTITNAMRYVWGDNSIGHHSFNMLARVFTAALVVDPAIAAQAGTIRVGASPFYYAYILLGGHGDDHAVNLADAIRSQAELIKAVEGSDLAVACNELSTIFGPGVTPSARKTMTEAPRNKAALLLTAEGWWSRPAKVSWDQILQQGWGVIVNVGPTPGGQPVDKQLKEDMVAMLMFSLYEAIGRNCSSWESEGRRVSVFSDELTEVAGQSPEIIEWMKDKGRSFGIQPVFATQRAGQLDPAVRESVLGFGTILAYTQDVPAVMQQLVADFSADGTEWSTADVANLPPFEAIVRSRVNRARQPAFTVKLANFEDNMSDYSRVQLEADAEDILL